MILKYQKDAFSGTLAWLPSVVGYSPIHEFGHHALYLPAGPPTHLPISIRPFPSLVPLTRTSNPPPSKSHPNINIAFRALCLPRSRHKLNCDTFTWIQNNCSHLSTLWYVYSLFPCCLVQRLGQNWYPQARNATYTASLPPETLAASPPPCPLPCPRPCPTPRELSRCIYLCFAHYRDARVRSIGSPLRFARPLRFAEDSRSSWNPTTDFRESGGATSLSDSR